MKKKYFKILFGVLCIFTLLLIFKYMYTNITRAPYAILLTKQENPQASYFIKNNELLETDSAEKADKITTNKIIAIIIDQSIINNQDTINEVKKYIQKNNDKMLIVTGYSNASYCFFKILDITNGKYLPPFNQTDYERLKKGKGYCVAFCQKTGQINGKSFEGDVDYAKIMELIQFTLQNKKSPDKIVKILGG